MNVLWMLAEAGETPSVFNLNMGTSFWTVIIFIALMLVLMKYAFPPILGYAEAREKRIQETLDEAKRQREESERLLEEHRRALVEARQQAQQIIAEGRTGAEKVRQDLLTEARREQEALLARTRQELERERESAVESLRREAVELSLAAASKLVGRRLDAEEDRRLVKEYLAGQAAGGSGAGAA